MRKSTGLPWKKYVKIKNAKANDGFDGSWVAHPDLVQVCTEVFSNAFEDGRVNQMHRMREDVKISSEMLLNFQIPGGKITEAGLRNNISVGIQYISAWLRGTGAVAIFNLMEDAATQKSQGLRSGSGANILMECLMTGARSLLIW
ncbi:MAG: hypothetical protein Ct9H300mP28_05380 [Pseudomonadota bacterium]|nr:MAG: hypothetical protein Ct9H300mP28_05380 [Pseudomonadota bacterium]